jgi:hypothetical protein
MPCDQDKMLKAIEIAYQHGYAPHSPASFIDEYTEIVALLDKNPDQEEALLAEARAEGFKKRIQERLG